MVGHSCFYKESRYDIYFSLAHLPSKLQHLFLTPLGYYTSKKGVGLDSSRTLTSLYVGWGHKDKVDQEHSTCKSVLHVWESALHIHEFDSWKVTVFHWTFFIIIASIHWVFLFSLLFLHVFSSVSNTLDCPKECLLSERLCGFYKLMCLIYWAV